MSKVETYKDKSGDWRWRIVADNGNIISESSEGYVNKEDMKRSIDITRITLMEALSD